MLQTVQSTLRTSMPDCTLRLLHRDARLERTERKVLDQCGSCADDSALPQALHDSLDPSNCTTTSTLLFRGINAAAAPLLLIATAPLHAPFTAAERAALRHAAAFSAALLALPEKLFAQLAETEKLAMIGRTVAAVAHELNGPLQTIISQAEALAASEPKALQEESAQRILRSGLRCRGIVQDLLSFGTPRPASNLPTDLRHCVMEALELDRWSDVGDVQVCFHDDETLPLVVADPARIVQVFTNLLANARQSSAASGCKEPVRIVLERASPTTLRASVSDRGGGIPAAMREHLFEAFNTTRTTGHGLGLWISRRIVEECGGTLQLDPSWSPGARFVVELLVAKVGADAVAPVLHDAAGVRVLVIDDDRELLDTYEALLSLDGHQVRTCDSAATALELLNTHIFDAIVCDLRLPDMSGDRFLMHLQQTRPDIAQRVILASGDVGRSDSVAFLASISNPVLLKPFRAEDLARAIQTVAALPQPRPH